MRGSRIRNIVDELGGEKIDIVRWNESSQVLISNSLKPAEVKEVFLCFELGRATVIVQEDQLSLAIGKRGQNVRLGARLTGWDIDISTPGEYDRNIDDMQKTLSGIEGVQDVMLDKMLAMGMVSLSDLSEVGVEPLVKDLELDEALAARIVEVAAEAAPRLEAERQAAKKAAAEAEAEAAKKAAEEAEAEAAAQTDADPTADSVQTSETPSEEPEAPVSSDTTDSDSTDDESGSTPDLVDSQTASETPAVQDVQAQSPTPAADTDVSAVKTGTVESSDPT